MSSPPSLARPNGRPSALGPSLPTFEPLRHRAEDRPARAESSASGSQRSESDAASYGRVHLRDSLSSFRSSAHEEPDRQDTSSSSRGNVKRNSGGFLLDPVAQPSRLSRAFLSGSIKTAKGKRRSQDSELSIPKRRLRDNGVRTSSGVASSPLATEVKPEAIVHNDHGNGNTIQGTGNRHSAPRSQSQDADQRLEITKAPVPSVGYDTDPVQIVSMALSLSEGRRRQASAKRYVSGTQAGNRVVSTSTTDSMRSRGASGSLAQYLSPQRRTSQNGSPRPRQVTPRSTHGQKDKDSPEAAAEEEEADDAVEAAFDDGISHATQVRVDKARAYFELAYEHRRLLSHLPPIRRPGASGKSPSLEGQSKAYNPLQYIRNRKLRIWDKSAIDAEADGWHDVEKVKQWVDTVVGGHRETRFDPDECVRLPPVSHASSTVDESELDSPKSKPPPRSGDVQPNRPRRPRSDWVTHPGDMIADCFWLEQGMNKVKILDRDNNQIYPANTQFKFSGWRNRTPVQVPVGLQEQTPPPEQMEEKHESQQPLHSPLPELPVFQSARNTVGRSSKGRKRDKIKGSIGTLDEDGIRLKGLRIFMDDSNSDSSRSTVSSDTGRERGRKRISRRRQKTTGMNGDKSHSTQRPNYQPKEEGIATKTFSPSDNSQPSSAPNSKRGSIDQSRLSRLLKRDSTNPITRPQAREELSRQDSIRPFPAFENDNPRSSLDYDTTAPSSPIAEKWPSIAINLESPPQSRSPSPSKRPRPSILNSFKDRIHEKHDKVSTADFADDPFQPASRNVSSETEKKSDSSTPASRGPSPMTRGQSPLSKSRAQSALIGLTPVSAEHRASTVSRLSTRTSTSERDHGRIRGMFKGGRIAELVGNEVSRVGDFIWKRDLPASVKHRGSTSDGSIRSYEGSDTEEEVYPNGSLYVTPPRPGVRRSRSSTVSSTKSDRTSPTFSRTSPPSADRPKYNNPNLPSFTSPFQHDRDRQEKTQSLLTPMNSPSQDHITLQAAHHRSQSRSPRLDKLAALKLDTSGPSRPDGLSREKSYGFSSSLDLTKPKDASDKYNSAIYDKLSPNIAALKSSKSAVELSRAFNISVADLTQELNEGIVSRRDITRAEALVLSSAVKAHNIGRRADAPRSKTPKFLLQTIDPTNQQLHTFDLSQVRRREEHVIAARNIMATLSTQASEFNDKLNHFSKIRAPSLHTELQTLEDMVENQMTPRVRVTADEAGELSMKLTTTSTMAVKGLNDTIEGAMRRRRRGPIRWVRGLWYVSIEWMVVFLLWGIWAVVTLIRVVIGAVSGVVKTVRWLLWLD